MDDPARKMADTEIEEEFYWLSVELISAGDSSEVRGPYNTLEEAIVARERIKLSIGLSGRVSGPFVASSKQEAISRAPFF